MRVPLRFHAIGRGRTSRQVIAERRADVFPVAFYVNASTSFALNSPLPLIGFGRPRSLTSRQPLAFPRFDERLDTIMLD